MQKKKDYKPKKQKLNATVIVVAIIRMIQEIIIAIINNL